MLGYIWIFLVASSIIIGTINGKIEAVTQAAFDSAEFAVEIAISLIGIMALWLGIMKLAEKSGLMFLLSKIIKPVTKRIFNDLPPEHPAIGNIAMNFSANALGLANAATPLGIKAMEEMQAANKNKKTATNAMCVFLGMNTAGFQLIPASAIAILAAAGSKNPTEIVGPALCVTSFAFITAIVTAKTLEKLPYFRNESEVE